MSDKNNKYGMSKGVLINGGRAWTLWRDVGRDSRYQMMRSGLEAHT